MAITRSALSALVLASVFAVGCNREEPEVPPAQMQSEQSDRLNVPTKLVGCLRAGEAADTYVLTTSLPEDGMRTATYELRGSGGVNLQEHVGSTVEVAGVVRDQQHIATKETPQPAGQQAKGTSGTPAVQTTTQLAVRTLDLQSVRRVGEACQ